jgi:hypothetical protein
VAVARDVTPTHVGAPSDALLGDTNFAEGRVPGVPLQPKAQSHLLSYLMMGGAGVSVATSAGLFFHARSLANSLSDPNTPDKPGVKSQINTEQTISNVLLGVTLAFAVGAVAFWNF